MSDIPEDLQEKMIREEFPPSEIEAIRNRYDYGEGDEPTQEQVDIHTLLRALDEANAGRANVHRYAEECERIIAQLKAQLDDPKRCAEVVADEWKKTDKDEHNPNYFINFYQWFNALLEDE